MIGTFRVTGMALAVLLVLSPAGHADDTAAEAAPRVVIWGSSVAQGIGDESMSGGYSGRLQRLLEPRGWMVVDRSRPGDNTTTIASRFEPAEPRDSAIRYLTDAAPDYVVIGLSLGNEGIAQCQMGQTTGCTSTPEQAEQVFEGFANGLQELVARTRAAGMIPIVTLPYARLDFSEREYAFTRRMNLLINSWNVPSVNLLGAIDDGQGRWARGFWADPFHPNAAGYTEMMHAFVPTLFAALDAGKAVPEKSGASGFARVRRNSTAPLTFQAHDVMRSFSLTFQVRVDRDGVVASIAGRSLSPGFKAFRRSYGDFSWDTESAELGRQEDRFMAVMSVADGAVTYRGADGNLVSSPVNGLDDDWHYVTLTHYVARGESLFYVNGELAGSLAENLQPEVFVLGGPADKSWQQKGAAADYREWMIHRAGLHREEIAALHGGLLLQSSLELYAPLVDGNANLAQSLSAIAVDGARVTFMQ